MYKVSMNKRNDCVIVLVAIYGQYTISYWYHVAKLINNKKGMSLMAIFIQTIGCCTFLLYPVTIVLCIECHKLFNWSVHVDISYAEEKVITSIISFTDTSCSGD